MKLKWKVATRPSGRYRSFESRGWPEAHHEDGRFAAMVYCRDENNRPWGYVPSDALKGEHPPLTVTVADHSVAPWKWRTLKQRFATLAEVKEFLPGWFDRFPEFSGKEGAACAPKQD